MNKKYYYITTPIYYPSANPHVGTAYTTVLADVLSRYKKLLGYNVFLTTGTDEHALKILHNATKVNKNPKEFVDDYSLVFKKLWKDLDINYDAFIRTTDKKHEDVVKKVYEKLDDLGLIILKKWNGWYCNSCEENYAMNNIIKNGEQYFCNQRHLLIKKSEDSLFFKLSSFTSWIKTFLFDLKPDLIYPETRRTELFNNFIKDGLEDLSISRISQDWGIEVLVDKYKNKDNKKHVAYVWIDALFSYLSALNFLQKDDRNYQEYWNNENVEIIHLMSKEITRFHAIFWPIFLKSLNLNLPNKIIAHGWIITPEGKMSKSLGNVIDPYEYINLYGSDALRFFFIKGLILENDSIFSKERFIEVYNTYLANTFGNLASRTHAMIKKYFNKIIPNISEFKYFKSQYENLNKLILNINEAININDMNKVVDLLFELNLWVNNFIETQKPWELYAKKELDKLEEVLHLLINIVRITFYYLSPILVNASKKILNSFGLNIDEINQENINNFNEINNKELKDLEIIFKRI